MGPCGMGKARRKIDPAVRRWLIEAVQAAERRGHSISDPTSWLTSETGGHGYNRYVPRCSCGWYSQANLGTVRSAYRVAFQHIGESLGDAYGDAARATIRGHVPNKLGDLDFAQAAADLVTAGPKA